MFVFFLFLLYSSPQKAMTPWDLLCQDNQVLAARVKYEKLIEANPQDDFAQIGWFLTFTGQGPTLELQNACLKVLASVEPGSPASEFVLIWMQPLMDFYPGFVESISEFLPRNPGDVGSFSLLKSYYLISLSRTRGDEALYETARDLSQCVDRWFYAPRKGQYPIPDFYKEWNSLSWNHGIQAESQSGTMVPPPQMSGPGVIFASTQFQNPRSQDVRFRLFSYQDIDVFLDGKLLTRHLGRETLGSAIVELSFLLDQGQHELLVKTTQTSENNGHFQIQLSANDPLKMLEPQKPQFGPTESKYTSNPYEDGLKAALDTVQPDSPYANMVSYLRALISIREKDIETARDILEHLMSIYPDSQLLGTPLIKLYFDGIPFQSQESQIGRAYKLLERLSSNPDSFFPENRLLLASVLIKAKKTKESFYLLQDLVSQNPGYCEALELLLVLSDKEELMDVKADILKLIENLGADHPWAQETLMEQARRDNNIEEEKKFLANLKHIFPFGKYEAQYYESMGDYRQAISSLEQRMKYYPDSAYFPYSIAKLYRRLGDSKQQYQWLEKAQSLDPTHKGTLQELINLDLYHSRKEQALNRIDQYLDLVPHDGFIRQMRSHLLGRTYFEPFRVDTSQILAEAAQKPKSEGADSELLLDQLMVRLFPDGSQMRYTHLITRVLTKKGVDMESQVQLPSHCEVLELRTIKQDGRVFYPENLDNQSTLTLSSIGVGDFIDEEHIEYLPPAYYDQDGLDSSMSFVFRGVDRIYHHSECVLIYPKDLPVEPQLYEVNFPKPVERTEKDGLVSLRWLMTEVPPLKPEPAMVDPAKIMPRISFSYNTEWSEIRDFFSNAVSSRMKMSKELKALALEWKQKEKDPYQRAKKLYRDITDQIEPDRQFYQDINLTWESKKGNATLLLAALYNEAGLPAHIVFSRSLAYEQVVLDSPFPELFFRALIKLDLPDQTVWLDANQKYLEFGYISPDFFGAKAIMLNGNEPPVSRIPELGSTFEPVEANYHLDITAQGDLDGQGTEKFYGLLASRLIPYYRDLTDTERLRNVEAGVNERFPKSQVTEVNLDDKIIPGQFSLSYQFQAKNWVLVKDSGLEMDYPLPKSPLRDHFATLAERKFSIGIDKPIENSAELTLTIPDGYQWSDIGKSNHISSPFGFYDLKIEKTAPNQIQLKRTYQLPTQEISPEEYPKFRKFCQDILDSEQFKLKASKAS